MRTVNINLFDIEEKELMSLLKNSGIALDGINYIFIKHNLESNLEIQIEDDYILADILNAVKQYLISTEGEDIFKVLATYIDCFNKKLIVFDNGSLGQFISRLTEHLNNKLLLKMGMVVNDLYSIQKLFDLSAAETSSISLVSEQNIYKISAILGEQNVSDYFITTMSVLSEPSNAEEKVFQPKGKSIILISNNEGKIIKVYKFGGPQLDISISCAQMTAWLLLQKIKFG